jgi:hypothetical protein
MRKNQLKGLPGPSVQSIEVGELLGHLPMECGRRKVGTNWKSFRGKVVKHIHRISQDLTAAVVIKCEDGTEYVVGPGDWDELLFQEPTDSQLVAQGLDWIQRQIDDLRSQR